MKYFKTAFITFILVFTSIQCSSADVGIIVASNANLEVLTKKLEIKETSKKAARVFYSGNFQGKKVVLVRSPMGKVNNAITAQVLLSSFNITSVISIAPAGAAQEGLNIGDGVIATEVYQHDFGTVKPYGFVWGRVPNGTSWDEPGCNSADKSLRKSALFYAGNIRSAPNKVVEGVVVSGDQFISSEQKKKWLSKKFKAADVDRGAAAIAQVCYASNAPFCILRIITDKAGLNARTDFEKAIPSLQTGIDIIGFVKGILQGVPNK
ncbi:MAG: 5'-methylthioadenosine/adenosylhomocysteine nucleosidase [Deltaproteobacteria bacterium]|nr:5'-methylthioadenosine/adenosylhomocysteine nucleosidase [Deltaproteobacteria bacterium]